MNVMAIFSYTNGTLLTLRYQVAAAIVEHKQMVSDARTHRLRREREEMEAEKALEEVNHFLISNNNSFCIQSLSYGRFQFFVRISHRLSC